MGYRYFLKPDAKTLTANEKLINLSSVNARTSVRRENLGERKTISELGENGHFSKIRQGVRVENNTQLV